MRLRWYIVLLSTLVVMAVLSVLALQSQQVLREGFNQIDSLQVSYVVTRIESIFSSKEQYLDRFMKILQKDPRLVKRTGRASTLKLLSEVKNDANFGVIALIAKNGEVVQDGWPAGRNFKEISTVGESHDLLKLGGENTLIKSGKLSDGSTLVLGYHLDEAFGQRIGELTNSSIQFSLVEAQKQLPSGVFKLYSGKTNALAAEIIPDKARLNVIIGSMRGRLLIASTILLVFLVLVLYLAFDFSFVRSVEQLANSMATASENLDEGRIVDVEVPSSRVTEISKLSAKFKKVLEALKQYSKKEKEDSRKVVEMEKSAALAGMAQQVAHDLRSPLSALDMFMETVDELPEDKRVMMRGCVHRITDIANSLLLKTEEGDDDSEPSTRMLITLVEPLVTEKRLKYMERDGLNIQANLNASSYGLFVEVNPQQFRRVISNIIDNSAEAIGSEGSIEISTNYDEQKVTLTIEDTGRGIPREILSKVAEKGFSYNKNGGSGLGLHYAKSRVEEWGGTLIIDSREGEGTRIVIELPRASAPQWFVPSLDVPVGSTVVVLDDDPSIHSLWKDRFARFKNSGVTLHHFKSADALEQWLITNPLPDLALIDFELLGSPLTGLDIIVDYHLQDRAVLITSRYDDPELKDLRLHSEIKLIPKFLAGFVPINQVSAKSQAV